MIKKNTWKSWAKKTILTLALITILWLINLIWFRPFNISHFYTKIFIELAIRNPELTTLIGMPILYDWYKYKLDDISDAKRWESFNRVKENYNILMSYNFKKQSESNKLNTRILSYYLEGLVEGKPFFYHKYLVNQIDGEQNKFLNLMENSHKLRNKNDIKAYIARLSKVGVKFDQLIEALKIAENKNIIPPKFVIERVINQMNIFIGTKKKNNTKTPASSDTILSSIASNILYTDFDSKIKKLDALSKEQKNAYKKQVKQEIETTVFEAYQKLINYLVQLKKKASAEDGVWKLPNGKAYYRYQLKQHTTTNLAPEEIHQIGLIEVARIKDEIQDILFSEGYTDTTKAIGARIRKINKEKRFLFPDNDEGRQMILDQYKRILSDINIKLDNAFDVKPKADLEIKRPPKFKEDNWPAAFYNMPTMDGTKGGIFYVNLKNVHESKKFKLKTLAYHEGIPGHHFQLTIQSELKDVPIFRTIGLFPAYIEGWALYAEYLAGELGFYKNDPFGNLGRLQAEIFRAARLVVDTGIHYKKWTREEAINYMMQNTGMSITEVTTEIERYIVWPGQACAYKIGMLKILDLRKKAKEKLGDHFQLKEFHNTVLRNGAVPLDILESMITAYIDKTLARL